MEFYNKEFPKTLNDFVYLSRPFTFEEIQLADKGALLALCVSLKQKELEYYTKYHELLNQIEVMEKTYEIRDIHLVDKSDLIKCLHATLYEITPHGENAIIHSTLTYIEQTIIDRGYKLIKK